MSSIGFHLTTVVHDEAGRSRFERFADSLLGPVHWCCFGGRQVTVINSDMLVQTSVYDRRSYLGTAARVVLFVPALIVGSPFKAVAVCLYHDKNVDSLIRRCRQLDTTSSPYQLFRRSGDNITPQPLDDLLRTLYSPLPDSAINSGIYDDTARNNIRSCLTERRSDLSLVNCQLHRLPNFFPIFQQHLRTLVIRCNHNLTNLPPLSDLTRLETLDISENSLTGSLDVSRLTALKVLNCSINQFTGPLSLPNPSRITQLLCSVNQFNGSLDLSSQTRLEELYCQSNQFTGDLHLSGLTHLKVLYCSSNRFTGLFNLPKLTHLTRLGCSGNLFSDSLDLSGLSQLEFVDCSENSLTSLNLSGLTQLGELQYHTNLFRSPPDLSCVTQLKYLNGHNYKPPRDPDNKEELRLL